MFGLSPQLRSITKGRVLVGVTPLVSGDLSVKQARVKQKKMMEKMCLVNKFIENDWQVALYSHCYLP